ncbi:MAG: chemotaxis protein CheA [Bdellovibrio sp.]|nr:chemotaxis protein CheA [Bdellovibrio sp.]
MDEFDEIKICFLDEAEQNLTDTEQCFLALERRPGPEILEKIFRLAHNLKGSSKAVGFDGLGAFTHDLETFLLKIKNGNVPLQPEVVDLLLRCNDHLKYFVAELRANFNAQVNSQGLLGEIHSYLADGGEAKAPAPAPQIVTKEEVQVANVTNVTDDMAAALAQLEDVQPMVQEASAVVPAETCNQELVFSQAEAAVEAPKANGSATNSQDESIRVSLARLERLQNNVGEMVILHSVLKEQSHGSTSLILKKTIHQLGKVTREVQDISMGLRMLPMKPTFMKLQRIVRDTSRALGKEIHLEMIGDDTELDKTVIEKLSDPLVHIVRNAVDHGIESPEEREEKGKPLKGTIKLNAYHHVGQINIEITDDGRGLDAHQLVESAIKKGLIRPDAKLSDDEAYHLIFAPGFSTKDVVTDVSGRGVGMDVVRTNIEQLRGRTQIETKVGEGTCFRITLPLTLAIIDAMIVRHAKERFVIPLHHIYESVQSSEMKLQSISGCSEILILRGENIPFYRLNTLLGRKGGDPVDNGTALIIRTSQNSPLAIFVDEVVGQTQAVIKTLGQEVRQIKGFSGSAILGDGLPSVILDIPALVERLFPHLNTDRSAHRATRSVGA